MIDNIKRTLTMLEKALGRLARQCYYDPKQYPEIFFEIEEYINLIRSWLRDNEIFASSEALYVSFGLVFESLGMMITQLWKTSAVRLTFTIPS